MISRFRYLLTNPRTLAILAILIVVGIFLFAPTIVVIILVSGAVLLAAALAVWWAVRRNRARKSSAELGGALTGPETKPATSRKKARDADLEALRERMRDAVKSIKKSRLGQTRGHEALYELPWYMIIGNPAAGKSTAIVNSGLRFPLADQHGTIIQGIGGTRNCDWYFTSEGIILDTAGRYSVHDENRLEWRGFLDLLRKHRSRAPINGIIIAASIAELTGNRPEFAIDLARKLRKRVQELTDCLEVIAPVYVVFTKADLIAGFNDFFRGLEDDERNRVWGATLPFRADGNENVVAEFDRHFDELSEGLREMSLAQMSLNRGNAMAPGVLTLPLEFAGIKASLRTFLSTLFEDNPFQYRPVFRGFYFTSALQEPESVHKASDRITQRFHLAAPSDDVAPEAPATSRSYFLLDLFRKVIFADKDLVRQYSSKNRRRARYAMLAGSAAILALVLSAWTWSYTGNRGLVASARADLEQAVAVQKRRVDLQSRLHALRILQDRLQQLQRQHMDRPLMLGLGLYQGDALEARLRQEYFDGMRQIMLAPVTQSIEAYLGHLVAHRDQLQAPKPGTATRPDHVVASSGQPAPISARQGYNALRAYLMLAHPDRVEPVQLADELTHFWRDWLNTNRGMMSRDELIGSTRKLMVFYVSQYDRPGWPTIDSKVALVEDTRGALRHVMRGMSAIDRVYAQIKARAATRFPAMTVASILGEGNARGLLAGSHPVPGPFTHAAWDGYIESAIRNAANEELSLDDWVLRSSRSTDLTLTGSPEQISSQLKAKYDSDYISQWRQFLRGVTLKRFDSFTGVVEGMNTLGDPQKSPLRTLLQTVHDETSWDNPAPIEAAPAATHSGVVSWFKRVILRQAPATVSSNVREFNEARSSDRARSGGSEIPATAGPIGGAFTGITQIMQSHGEDPALIDRYMTMLGNLRTRLDRMQNRGEAGPAARKLIMRTLGDDGSELSDGLMLVEQRMLNGLDDTQRGILRPLLLGPLMQTFHSLIEPAENDLNKIWAAQVYEPFREDLAAKYPFDGNGRIEATNSEIAQIFGPAGAIAKFVTDTLGPLVNQRGSTLTAKQWAGMGITLSPVLMAEFGRWTSPLGQTTISGNNNQTVFQIRPGPARNGISEYTININGQKLRYRNTPPKWKSFVWSGSQTGQLTEISATTLDGRNVTLEKFTGAGALTRLFQAAGGNLDKQTGIYTLTWTDNDITVSVRLRIISSPQVNADGTLKQSLAGTRLPAVVVGDPDAAMLAQTNGSGENL